MAQADWLNTIFAVIHAAVLVAATVFMFYMRAFKSQIETTNAKRDVATANREVERVKELSKIREAIGRVESSLSAKLADIHAQLLADIGEKFATKKDTDSLAKTVEEIWKRHWELERRLNAIKENIGD